MQAAPRKPTQPLQLADVVAPVVPEFVWKLIGAVLDTRLGARLKLPRFGVVGHEQPEVALPAGQFTHRENELR